MLHISFAKNKRRRVPSGFGVKDVRGGQTRPGAVSEEEPAALRPAGRARWDAAPPATRDARALREDPAGRRRERVRPRGRPAPSPRLACAGEPLSPPGSAGGPAGCCDASSELPLMSRVQASLKCVAAQKCCVWERDLIHSACHEKEGNPAICSNIDKP